MSRSYRTFVLLLALFVSVFVVPSHAHGGHDDEPMNEPSNPSGTVTGSFPSPDDEYTLTWSITGDEISFKISAELEGWVSVGFAPQAWQGADLDLIYAYVNNTNHSLSYVVDAWWPYRDWFNYMNNSWYYDKPFLDETLGGVNNVVGTVVYQEEDDDDDKSSSHSASKATRHGGAMTVLQATRKLSTGDKFDSPIINGNITLWWAYGTEGFWDNTTVRGLTSINFYQNWKAPMGEKLDEMYWIKVHGIMMTFIIFILMGFSMVFARYLKNVYYYWFYIHAGLFVTATALFITSMAIIFAVHDNKFVPSWHSVFGIIFIICFGTQVLLGWYSHIKFDPRRTAPPFFPDKLHWYMARVVAGLSVITIGFGLQILPANASSWVLYVFLVLTWGAFAYLLDRNVGQSHEGRKSSVSLRDESHKGTDEDDERESKIPSLTRNLSMPLGRILKLGSFFVCFFFLLLSIYIGKS